LDDRQTVTNTPVVAIDGFPLRRDRTVSAALRRIVRAQLRDVSANGCLLDTESLLPIGTIGILDVEIDGEGRSDWVRICRTLSTHGRSGSLAGAEFLPVNAADPRSLRDTIRRWLRSGARMEFLW
jgi:hypothetical protein